MQRAPLLPRARWFFLAGAVLIFAALGWGVISTPLPYPDPTPEQYARQALEIRLFSQLILTGLGTLFVGFVIWLVRAVLHR